MYAEPIRVLLVDDEPVSRELLGQVLRMAGYEVLTTDTGERALLLLREWRRRIHWLFTAVKLPGLVDGWILGDEYHACHPERPVLYAAEDSAGRCESRASMFVAKPIAPMDVVATVKRLSQEFDAPPAKVKLAKRSRLPAVAKPPLGSRRLSAPPSRRATRPVAATGV